MARGVASGAFISIFRQLPYAKRIRMRTITTDLSSAMMLTARKSFPHAKLINDRLHVQQLMSEAVDQFRIRRRWQILDQENKAIREHRSKRKPARTKIERQKIGEWVPVRMDNGETMP